MIHKKNYHVIYRVPTSGRDERSCVLEVMARSEKQAKKQAKAHLKKICSDAEVIKAEEVKKNEK